MNRSQAAAKRAFDVVASLAAIVVLSPLFPAIAAVTVLSSGFPILFVQERVGRGGRMFRIIKFRTMIVGSEKRTQGQWITNANPYVTPWGRLLRKTSLDELPELLNVFRGDMSLVGPRPTLAEQVARYDEFQRRRLEAMPGVTGWAQVNGRNRISWTERIKLDVWYIDHWSFGLDMRILLMTVWQALRQQDVDDVPPPDSIVGG